MSSASSASSPSPLGPAHPPPSPTRSPTRPPPIQPPPSSVAPTTPPPSSPPRKKPRVEHVMRTHNGGAALPAHLPNGPYYQRSYMMRYPVQCLFTSSSSIVVASLDAALTFWARSTTPPATPSHEARRDDTNVVLDGVNNNSAKLHFVKRLHAHKPPLLASGLSKRADALLTSSVADSTLKLFSTPTFELLHVHNLSFQAGSVLLHIELQSAQIALVSHKNSPALSCFTLPELEFRADLTCPHAKPLTRATYNHAYSAIISIDEANVIDYWAVKRQGNSYHTSVDIPQLEFRSKLRTDLFYFARNALVATSMDVSSRGSQFAVADHQGKIHIFHFLTGHLRSVIDLSLPSIRAGLTSNAYENFGLNRRNIDNRLEAERVLKKHEQLQSQNNVVFDETGKYVLYATVLGIHLIHVSSCTTVIIYGLNEHQYRFVNVSICAGDTIDRENGIPTSLQPLVVASAFKSQRIFLFGASQAFRKGRDVMNEPLYTDSKLPATPSQPSKKKVSTDQLVKRVTLHTTFGDVMLQLYGQQAPKTVENFSTHARNGYYDGVVFHRVIRGFIVQSGDPEGNGTGGESIWGVEFEDEINPSLKHDVGILSMANAGPNTNGSQFFITCGPAPHLNGKHTVFGKVMKGMTVVRQIENVKVDKHDKPFDEVRIESISVYSD
ncbi:unnamed protein product [Agarophyton chilense]